MGTEIYDVLLTLCAQPLTDWQQVRRMPRYDGQREHRGDDR
jgi:hypothetical protein